MPRFQKRLTFSTTRVSVGDALEAVVRERLKAVRFYLGRLHKEAKPAVETVHQLRVWSRRATAAVDLFRSVGDDGPWRKLRKRLKKLRRAAGEVRDWDVLVERIVSDEQFGKRIRGQLDRERAAARERLSAAVRDGEKIFAPEKLQDLQKKVQKAPNSAGRRSFRRFMTERLVALVERFRECGEDDLQSPDILHEFRIAGKELRYALEIALAVFPSKGAERLYAELTELQDELGVVCDHRAAAEQFTALAKRFSGAETKKVFRQAARRERAAGAAGTEQFLGRWTSEARLSWAARCDKLLTAGKPR